jgi:hypothetical protein
MIDKCEVAINDLNDSIENARITYKKVEMLTLLYELENREEMTLLINNLLEFDRKELNYIY